MLKKKKTTHHWEMCRFYKKNDIIKFLKSINLKAHWQYTCQLENFD